jgi:hypothetical protein
MRGVFDERASAVEASTRENGQGDREGQETQVKSFRNKSNTTRRSSDIPTMHPIAQIMTEK